MAVLALLRVLFLLVVATHYSYLRRFTREADEELLDAHVMKSRSA
jgi:hypothetical protein